MARTEADPAQQMCIPNRASDERRTIGLPKMMPANGVEGLSVDRRVLLAGKQDRSRMREEPCLADSDESGA